MIIYLLKFIACTGILYTFYHLVLRNDKLFRFNRLFLLSIVVMAAVIPLITVKTSTIEVPVQQNITMINPTVGGDVQTQLEPLSPSAQVIDLTQYLVMAYIAITSLLLIRFMLNLWSLNRFKKGGKVIHSKGTKIVLRSDITHSFSFLNHIYTHKESFEQGMLPKEIIAHEQAHIRQKHSYDILFLEFISCLCWFNPIIFLIKRAIQLNHEFLADEAVISETGALAQYQNIIINFASQQLMPSPKLVSHLSFGETKKRITIMAKTKNTKQNLIRQVIAISMIIALFTILGRTEIIAQQATTPPPTTPTQKKSIKAPEVIKVPKANKSTIVHVISKQVLTDSQGSSQTLPHSSSAVYPSGLRWSEENGTEGTFEDLPKHLQDDFLKGKPIVAKYWSPRMSRNKVTDEMLKDYLDSKKYGVWIDGKRVDNTELKQYSPADIHHVFQSALLKNAIHYGKYTFQLNVYTEEYMKGKPNGKWVEVKLLNLKLLNERYRESQKSK